MTPQSTAAAPAANPMVFDRQGEFTIAVKLAKKTITVRFPSDEQLCRRQAGIRTIFKRHGMDGSTTDIQGQEEADANLIQSIRISGDPLDEAEASVVVEKLLRADAED